VTIHLISVGRSILDFLADPYRRLRDDAFADQISVAMTTVQDLADSASSAQVSDTLLRWLTDPGSADAAELIRLCQQADPARWPAGVSAELDTFDKAAGLGARLTSGGTAVLITSDTPVGLMAALWNALALTGANLHRVRYLPDLPASFDGLRGSAVITRVPRLDARNSDDFRTAMEYLGHLGRGLLDHVHRPEEKIRFYLSGGFKATIPYLIGLAEGLRSRTTAEVTACVLHEATNKTIELPLRRLPKSVVDRQLAPFVHNVSTEKPPSNELEGYAYEATEDGKRWELTAFGAGLRALYGLGNEAL
jgi:hypothetical protein